jgi:hypothetical protein
MNATSPLSFKGLACALVVAAVGAAAAVTSATPPGTNGQIAFARFAYAERAGEPSRGAIFAIGVDGRGERQVTRPPAGASDTHPD